MRQHPAFVPMATFALAVLLSVVSGSRSGIGAFLRPAGHETGSPLCSKVAKPSIVCPDHESKGTFEFTVVLGGTMKAAVTAYTDLQWVQVHTGSVVFALPIGVQPRADVKEYIRGWCRLFADPQEAERVRQEVLMLFAERRGLEEKHRLLRLQIMVLETDLNTVRHEQADFFTGRSRYLDEREARNVAAGRFDEIVKDREDVLKKGNSRQEKDAKQIERLERQIAALEQQVDDNLELIKAVDRRIDGLLGEHVETRVAEVELVVFEQAPGGRTLDANPNLEGGQRIFPDAEKHGDGESRNVQVRAKIKPALPGLQLFFRVFDRDDPLSDAAPLDPTGPAGRDNFARVAVRPPGGGPVSYRTELQEPEFDGGTDETEGVTDAQGEVKKILQVTMQPGHNFEVAVDCSREEVRRYDDRASSNNRIPKRISSGMLTVWRKTWVEADSFPRLPDDLPSHIVEGRIKASTRSADERTAITEIEVDADDAPAIIDSPHRWIGGRLDVDLPGFQSFEIVDSRIGSGRIIVTVNTIRLPGGFNLFPPDSPLNVRVRLYDDDFIYTGGRNVDRGLLPNTALPTGELKRVFSEAYVEIRTETLPEFPEPSKIGRVGGEPFLNEAGAIPSNLIGYQADNYDYARRGSRKPHLWTGYVVAGFQGLTTPFQLGEDRFGGDGDGDREFVEGGVTLGLTTFDRASIVYLESIRDAAAFETWKVAEHSFILQKVVAHEFAHQWGLLDGTGGLMSYQNRGGGANDPKKPSPLLLTHLQLIRTDPDGPSD